MNDKDILEIIRLGENSAVEFKEKKIRAESLAKEIVAFANMNGGVILLGVDDSGRIIGIDSENFNYEEWACNISRNNVIPSIQIEYSLFQIDTNTIAVINIPKGKDKPYQTVDGKYLVRVGSTNRLASINELMRLFQESGIFHYDNISVEKTSSKNLNLQKIALYFERYKLDFELLSEEERFSLIKNSDILSDNGELTIAGLLIFGINPQRFLMNASISFAHFKGNEISSELIDKQNIEGTIDYQIDLTVAIIKNNIKYPSTIIGTRRTEEKTYPEKVFRELVVNACCHRNYSIKGSRIRIFLFDNRLEVISPGKLPNTVNIDKLRAGVSYAVNPVILKFLENLSYIDKLGRGLPMVCREAAILNKEVIFEEIGEEFKVTLFL